MTNRIPSPNLWYEPSPFQNRDAYLQKNHNWAELSNYGLNLSSWFMDIVENYDSRFNNMIANSQKTNEVVDARMNQLGKVYPTLKAHLDDIEANKISYTDSKELQSMRTIRLKDLDENSQPIKLANKNKIYADFNNPLDEGLYITKTATLTVNKVESV